MAKAPIFSRLPVKLARCDPKRSKALRRERKTMGHQITADERRVAGAQALLLAKMAEFGAHVVADNRKAAERTREEASAALEAYFDLTDQSIMAAMKKGY